MSDIFGPDTNLKIHERNIAEKLARGREILYPIFDDKKLVSLYNFEAKNKSSNFSIDILSTFNKDLIIPFDFINIPNSDFMSPKINSRNVRAYAAEYKKFIGKPDLFYVGFDENNAHVFPVDLKSRKSYATVKQLSQLNTSMLYYHSNYMRKIVSVLNRKYANKVIFENGFYLFEEDYLEFENSDLEMYVKKYLPKVISKKHLTKKYLGINFENNKVELVTNTDLIFDTKLNYDVKLMKESDRISYMKFVKNRLNKTTTYPNRVLSFSGFNGNDEVIKRLDLDPTSMIGTYNPEINILQKQIEEISKMSVGEVYERFETINISFHESQLVKLETLLVAKKRDLNFRVLNRLEDSNLSNSNLNVFSNTLKREESSIQKLEFEISQVKKKVFQIRDDRYLNKIEKGSSEWYLESLDFRNSLINNLDFEIKRESKKLESWNKKDRKLTDVLSDFYLNSLFNENFTLATNSYFPLPTELFLQFNSQDVMKIALYNSYKI